MVAVIVDTVAAAAVVVVVVGGAVWLLLLLLRLFVPAQRPRRTAIVPALLGGCVRPVLVVVVGVRREGKGCVRWRRHGGRGRYRAVGVNMEGLMPPPSNAPSAVVERHGGGWVSGRGDSTAARRRKRQSVTASAPARLVDDSLVLVDLVIYP